jgi:hypothetical protein
MPSSPVKIERLDSVPLAVIRRQAQASELSRVVPECCGLVWEAVRAQQAKGGASHRALLGCQHPPRGRRRAVRAFTPQGDVVLSATPAGVVASATYFGPYGGLGAAHEAVRRWCEDHQRGLAGPSWEIYGHWQDDWNANPSRIRTDVYYLLA